MVNIALLGQNSWDDALRSRAMDMVQECQGPELDITSSIGGRTDAVIILKGSEEDRQDARIAYESLMPIITVKDSGGLADQLANKFQTRRFLVKGTPVDLENCVRAAASLGTNRRSLASRLVSVDLDLDTYELKPKKFVRTRPNCQGGTHLEALLNGRFKIGVRFRDTPVPGLYEASQFNIGRTIRGRNNFYLFRDYVIQDPASVLAVLSLDVRAHQNYLELGAATGTKIIHVNDLLNGQLDMTAVDWSEGRFHSMEKVMAKYSIDVNLVFEDAKEYLSQEIFSSEIYWLVDLPNHQSP